MQYYQECIALGSKTGLSLVTKDNTAKIDELFRTIWKEVFLFEKRFSRFIPDSELSTFNRNAGTKQYISREFHDILTRATRIAEQTKGLFNPFVLPAVQSAGYDRSRVPGHEYDVIDDHSDKSIVDFDKIEIGNDWAKIPYFTAIDLGGCGKGYLGEKLRSQMPDYIIGYWMSFGGDIALDGQDKHNQPWVVGVQDANDQSKDIVSIDTADLNAIATSGTNVLRGRHFGKSWHHIIDPKTKLPAKTDIVLATVCDTSLFKADVLASCAVILGSQHALKFLKNQGAKAGIIQYRTSKGENHVSYYGNSLIMKGTDV